MLYYSIFYLFCGIFHILDTGQDWWRFWLPVNVKFQLLMLNEYAARYAVARHYLGLVDVDE